MNTKDLENTMQRAQRYWYVDGLIEIYAGVIFLLLGVYFWLQSILPEGSMLSSLLIIGQMLLIIFGGLVGNRVVNWAKARLTYPRTGYVSYRQPPRRNRWIAAVVALILSSSLVALLATSPQALLFIHTASGLIIGLVFLYIGTRFGLLRYQILAVISILTGVGITWLGMDVDPGSAVYYATMGLAIVLTGVIILVRYLRSTEPADLDEWEPQA